MWPILHALCYIYSIILLFRKTNKQKQQQQQQQNQLPIGFLIPIYSTVEDQWWHINQVFYWCETNSSFIQDDHETFLSAKKEARIRLEPGPFLLNKNIESI